MQTTKVELADKESYTEPKVLCNFDQQTDFITNCSSVDI